MLCRFCHMLLFLLMAGAVSLSLDAQVPATNGFPVLTNAAQVRALSPQLAARKLPVKLSGILMDYDIRFGEFSLMDHTVGIYAEGTPKLLAGLSRGDLIEVDGVSDPGSFAPFVHARAVRKVGAGEIPEPVRANVENLLSGRLDAQWIEVSGVVRHVEYTSDGMTMEVELENGGGRILAHRNVIVPIQVDSTVQLQGVCYYQFNKTRQAIRPYLAIPPNVPVLVTEPVATNLNDIPPRSIGSLMQFNTGETYAHRIRVRGYVIRSLPGEGFWVHDAGHGIHVISEPTSPIKVGEEIEVLGFLKRGDYGPEIEDATFQKTGQAVSVMPMVRLSKASEALNHDADLVQCDATIIEQWTTIDSCRLKLADGTTEFPATLHITNRSMVPHWDTGTRIRVVGVCTVGFFTKPTIAGTVEPQFFQLLLRSPADVVILQLPSWWNAEHIAWLTGGVAATLLAAVAIVIWTSRRRLQAEALERAQSEAAFAAILNERNRMAREIHDTLSQGLSAISMQMEVVKRQLPPESKIRESLEVARSLARTNMTAARKAIWNMRSQDLEDGDLATALGDVLRNLTEGSESKGELHVRGRMRRFAPVTENNLLRIGQEAITNAAKYAQAKNILVILDFEDRQFRMSVKDDGKGFNVHAPPPSEGGIGLKAVRERAEQLHAQFSMASEPGKGTTILLALPVSP